jgi:uncharacterized protein (DUF1499 family)
LYLLALLASLVFPACAHSGTGGLPPARPIDPLAIARPSTPNTALAAPAGFSPQPDIETPLYKVAPAALFADVEKLAAAQPRTYLQGSFAHLLQAQYVVRSAAFNFPDLVMAQVLPGPDKSSARLVLWSRSVYGRSDFGVNTRRVRAWLAALATVPTAKQEK